MARRELGGERNLNNDLSSLSEAQLNLEMLTMRAALSSSSNGLD
jgi:hypothetical protein